MQGLEGGEVPEDVAVHGEQQRGGRDGADVRLVVRGGRAARPRRRLRLPLRVHHARLPPPEELQPHTGRRPPRQQGQNLMNIFTLRKLGKLKNVSKLVAKLLFTTRLELVGSPYQFWAHPLVLYSF